MAQNVHDFSEDAMVPLPAPIPVGLVKTANKAQIISGDVATGKTQQLINAIQALLASGVDSREILVFCATPTAATYFKSRLTAACASADHVIVTTPRQHAQALLGQREISEAVGRGNRLLAPFEMDFLMEDLKTSGVRPGRLKEMLRFFYKSLTELCDWEEEAWLLTGEENMVWDVLQGCLHAYGAILEPELANTVARYLHEHASAQEAYGAAYVFVDDYQLLNRASQVFVNELVRESITITVNLTLHREVFDSYPYAAGIDEFKEANPAAALVELQQSYACSVAQHCHDGLTKSPFIDALAFNASCEAGHHCEIELLNTPGEECQAVAQSVEAALASGVNADEVVVVSPHRMWDVNIAKALKQQGITVQTITDGSAIRGDLRDLTRSEAARVLTALFLVADPTNALAWRVWCGFGDHFANSSAVSAIRTWAQENNLPFDQALFAYYEAHDPIEQNVAEHAHVQAAAHLGREIITQAQGKTGNELLAFLTKQVIGESATTPSQLLSLVGPTWGSTDNEPDQSAQSMTERARNRMDFPGLDSVEGVKMLPLNQLTGITVSDLIICGFVNGFMPCRGVLDREILTQEDADKQTTKDIAALMNAVAKPTRFLKITGFKELPLENAERLKLRIHRIQLKDGMRVALMEPSLYGAYFAQ